MKVRLLLIVTTLLLLMQVVPAEAGARYWKHRHPGTIHYHKIQDKKMTQRVYVRYLEKKFSEVKRPHRSYSKREFARLLKLSGWPKKHWKKVYRVSTCESHRQWRPSNGTYVGLMQHRPGNSGMSRRQLENPVLNLMAAKWMYKKRGWQPWPVCGRR